MPSLHLPGDDALLHGSVLHDLPELQGVEVRGLLPAAVEPDAELVIATITLRPGQRLPLHRHDRPETVFVLEGPIRAQRGQGSAEIPAPGAAYFPANIPHSVAALDDTPATLLICCSRADRPAAIGSRLVDTYEDPSAWPNPNRISGADPLYRWALAEDYEPWKPVEPTKGWRLKLRYLFDPHRGAPELVAGVAENQPHTHYTIHRHEPPELYHVLDGSGVIHVGDHAYPVSPGSTVYVPADVPHGIDTSEERLRLYWVYGLERCGADWVWAADELVQPRPTPRPRSR